MNVIQLLIGLLTLLAVAIAALSVREFFYLRGLRLREPNEDLWLLDAVRFTSGYLTFTALYLLILSGLNAFGTNVSEHFPPLRVLTSLILLGVLYLPVYLGRQMRKRRKGPRVTLLDSLRR